jgi:hypothetical protein
MGNLRLIIRAGNGSQFLDLLDFQPRELAVYTLVVHRLFKGVLFSRSYITGSAQEWGGNKFHLILGLDISIWVVSFTERFPIFWLLVQQFPTIQGDQE